MPTKEITTGLKSAKKFAKKQSKKWFYTKIKVYIKETPTTYGYSEVSWFKSKRPGFKKPIS